MDGFDEFFDDVIDDLAAGFGLVHRADNLPNEVIDQLLGTRAGGVGGFGYASLGGLDENRLHRHSKRVGCVGVVPLFGPGGLEHAGVFAGK